jgi:chromosome segregation ATPase
MKDEKGSNDLEFIIQEHKQEIWAYKQKESEWEHTKNQLDGTKQIVSSLTETLNATKQQLNELTAQAQTLQEINHMHETLNASLRKEINELKSK